jgi:hypothetical protein
MCIDLEGVVFGRWDGCSPFEQARRVLDHLCSYP